MAEFRERPYLYLAIISFICAAVFLFVTIWTGILIFVPIIFVIIGIIFLLLHLGNEEKSDVSYRKMNSKDGDREPSLLSTFTLTCGLMYQIGIIITGYALLAIFIAISYFVVVAVPFIGVIFLVPFLPVVLFVILLGFVPIVIQIIGLIIDKKEGHIRYEFTRYCSIVTQAGLMIFAFLTYFTCLLVAGCLGFVFLIVIIVVAAVEGGR